MNNLTCPNCGIQFTTEVPSKRYCTKKCKDQAIQKRRTVRKKQPLKHCKACGQPKPSAKGDYCSKSECQKAAYWESRGGEATRLAHEKELQRRAQKRTQNSPIQGPKGICQNCGQPLKLIRSRYCGKTECRTAARHEYKRQNRERIRASRKDHKMKRRDAFIAHVDIAFVYQRDNWTCQLCGKHVDKRLTYPHPQSASLDHIVPISKGGKHMPANVQLAHWRCNVSKGAYGGGEQLVLL